MTKHTTIWSQLSLCHQTFLASKSPWFVFLSWTVHIFSMASVFCFCFFLRFCTQKMDFFSTDEIYYLLMNELITDLLLTVYCIRSCLLYKGYFLTIRGIFSSTALYIWDILASVKHSCTFILIPYWYLLTKLLIINNCLLCAMHYDRYWR